MDNTLQTTKAAQAQDTLHPEPSKHNNQLPRTFSPSNPADLLRFEQTCRDLWEILFTKGCQESNYPYYHLSSNTFSKKKYAKSCHYHLPDQTHKMSTWLKFHKIGDAKQMADFLLDQVKQREDGWFTVPGLNLPHNCDYPVHKTQETIQEKTLALEKRKATFETELAKVRAETESLKRQLANERQLRSDDKMKFDLILIRLKDEGRLLPPSKDGQQSGSNSRNRPGEQGSGKRN